MDSNSGSGLAQSAVTDNPLWLRAAPVIFLIFWSSGFTFAKMGLMYAQPMTLLALRHFFALLVLGGAVLVFKPSFPKTIAAWSHVAVVGVLMQVMYFSFVFYAIVVGLTAGAIALIASLTPILVAMFAPRFVDEKKINVRGWAGLALGLTGAVLVILVRMELEVVSVVGVLCGAGALLTMTSVTLYQKKYGVVDDDPVGSNFVQYGIGVAATLPVALLVEDMDVQWSTELFIALVYLVIANSLISVTLLLAMIRRKQAARVSMLFFLVPPTAALVAWIILDEVLPPLAWLGMALAGLGVAIANKASSPAPLERVES